MARSTPEWRGKTDDEPFPRRVRRRILVRFDFHCGGCGRLIVPGAAWTCDHKIALVNGGANRESNGQPLCEFCNPEKNKADVAEKAKTYAMAASAFGLKRPKGRPMDGSRASRWKKPMNGPAVLRPGHERRV